jgi:hypothetical protein
MPNEEKSIIRSIASPSIPLDVMQMQDLYTGSSEANTEGKQQNPQMHLGEMGTKYPFLMIGGTYTPSHAEIVKFHIDCTGFIPRVYVKIAPPYSASFKTANIPKDGDLVSVFIRAKNDAFKPIRNDYIVTYVQSSPGVSEGRGGEIEIFGSLFIPRGLDERIKSFKGTSFKVLQDVAKELGLGFATNEVSTDDEQNWICAGGNYLDFMQHIARHSYKDDKSFYKCFIDVYYHLNFININNQVDGDGILEAAILDQTMQVDYRTDDKEAGIEADGQKEFVKALSDIETFKGSNAFIQTMRPISESSAISRKYGYKSHVQFFDQASEQMWDLFVDPITSTGAEQNKIINKGRPKGKNPDGTTEDYWLTQNKKYWMGIQYKDVHDKYIFAELWNERNLAELEKLYLEVQIERWNPNIYKCEKIPIIVYIHSDVVNKNYSMRGLEQDVPANEAPAITNNFYSGWYMVDGFRIEYSILNTPNVGSRPGAAAGPEFTQMYKLVRREWPIPQGPINDPATATR